MSTKPGATTAPPASRTRSAVPRTAPSAAMRPPRMPRSPGRAGAPVPSIRSPPRSRRSNCSPTPPCSTPRGGPSQPRLGGRPGNHGGCGERSGGCERRARSSLLRRAFRHASSVVAALAALAPRLVRLAHHDYPDGLLVERVPQVELPAARRVVDAGLALVLGREALALARVVRRAPIARGGGVEGQLVGAARARAAVRPRLVRHPGVEHDQVAGLGEERL